jgi:hypothetical protein
LETSIWLHAIKRVAVAAEGTPVQISIMTTTLLCRRIYMGTRGCTSKGGEEGGA